MIYHVSVHGADTAPGTASQPFRTINHAAQIAVAGDTIQVHTGVYREWVKPRNGGTGDDCRITYEAAPGESPVIKGSEVITDWEHVESTVYKKVIPNDFFGDFNPFAERIFGDWLQRPIEYHLHLGDVYINGKSMYEAKDMESLYAAEKREFWFKHVLTPWQEYILHPEDTIYQWHAQVDAEFTTITVWNNNQ